MAGININKYEVSKVIKKYGNHAAICIIKLKVDIKMIEVAYI